jgi:protein-disulfide isomerase
MTRQARRERRQAEFAARRESRRSGRTRSGQRSPIVPISLGALGLGVVAVIIFALAQPPGGPVGEDVRTPLVPAPYELADGRALGVADAPVIVEVWSDFQCPACGRFAIEIKPSVIDDYVRDGRVRFVYRDFAFLGNESVDASIAARCGEQQGRFWQVHDFLFANQAGENRGAFAPARLEQIAQAAGLDLDAYRTCRADAAARTAVSADTAQGRAAGVNATPTLAVNGQLMQIVSYAELRSAIDAALGAAGNR